MTESPRDSDTQSDRCSGQRSIDEDLLVRAAQINDSIAGEFDERAASPLENAVLGRMASLGVETEAAVSVAIQRAHGIAFYMRYGRRPRNKRELHPTERELDAEDLAEVAALAVAWWDGALTALRARELENRRHAR
jgi:hypothetical protein